MPDRRAIVNPVKGKTPPETGALAIIAATETDVHLLSRLADTPMVEQRKLYMSQLQIHADDHRRFALVSPLARAEHVQVRVHAYRALARLDHPHVVRIHDLGSDGARHWLGTVTQRLALNDRRARARRARRDGSTRCSSRPTRSPRPVRATSTSSSPGSWA